MLSSTFRIDITFPSTRRATVLIDTMGTKGDREPQCTCDGRATRAGGCER